MCRVHLWTSRKLDATLSWVNMTYLEHCKAELGHVNLIRNISLMRWNLEVQLHQIIPCRWPYMSISELGHVDLLRDLSHKELEIGYCDLFGFLRICSLVWTEKVLQTMGIVFSCQPLLWRVRLEFFIKYKVWEN